MSQCDEGHFIVEDLVAEVEVREDVSRCPWSPGFTLRTRKWLDSGDKDIHRR